MAKPKIIRAPCNDCGHQTDHLILKRHEKSGSDQETQTWWQTTYQMLECRGCHSIGLKRTSEFSEHDVPEVQYFPPPISRRKPAWEGELLMSVAASSQLPELMGEIYSALHADNRRLATMGARALLDIAIVDSVGDAGRFDQKLQALQEKGLIGQHQREILDAALDTGSAASHRGHCPTAKQLNNVMDIVEHVLQQIYVLPHLANELVKSTPQRKPGKK